MIHLKYEINKRGDALLRKIVWHLPKRMVMWAYIRVASYATTGQYGDTIVTDIKMMEALERWPSK